MYSDKIGTQSSVLINQVSLFPLRGVCIPHTAVIEFTMNKTFMSPPLIW